MDERIYIILIIMEGSTSLITLVLQSNDVYIDKYPSPFLLLRIRHNNACFFKSFEYLDIAMGVASV